MIPRHFPQPQASSTPTWASPRAPHWSWAPRWARGKRCRPGCTSIRPRAPFRERHRCWRMPESGGGTCGKHRDSVETQQMASLKKWLFFFLTFRFFLNVLMIFGTFDPIALWNTSRCSSTLLQPFLHWLLCSKAQWIYLADMATLCGLGSCGVWAWCARLDTQTLRQEIRRPPAPPPCPGFIDTNQEPEEFHITAMSGAKNSDGFQQDHAVFARKEAS